MGLGFNPKDAAPAASFDFEEAVNAAEISEENLTDEVVQTATTKPSNKRKYLFILLIAVLVLIVVAVFMRNVGTKDNLSDSVPNEQPTNSQGSVSDGEPKSETSTNYGKNDNKVSTGVVGEDIVDPAHFTDSFEGNTVPLNYSVKDVQFVNEMVNYERRRAITGQGIELFWLDILYKDREYRCQVPYYIYVQMEDKGITIVNMEVLTLEDDSTIVSFMQVISNYKELIQR